MLKKIFLSHPVVNGFTNAAAVIIASSQLSMAVVITTIISWAVGFAHDTFTDISAIESSQVRELIMEFNKAVNDIPGLIRKRIGATETWEERGIPVSDRGQGCGQAHLQTGQRQSLLDRYAARDKGFVGPRPV